MKNLSKFITLILIVLLSYSSSGQTNFKTIQQGKDTLICIPIQSIKSANSVKAMNDESKLLIDELNKEKILLRQIIDATKAENNSLLEALVNRGRKIMDLQKQLADSNTANIELKEKLAKRNKIAPIIATIVIVQTAIIFAISR